MRLAFAVMTTLGLTLIGSASAHADQDFYIGGSVVQINDDDFELDGFTSRVGWNFSNHFGVEGEATFATGEDQQRIVAFELSDTYAVFATARIAPLDTLDLVFRTGLIDTGVDISAPNFSDTEKRRSAAVGVHANWYLGSQIGVRSGYTYSKSDTFELGLFWRF
ncbi:MAG: porin family protein [Pseudomonadota bacterium]